MTLQDINIIGGAALLVAGSASGYGLLLWKQKRQRAVRVIEAESIIAEAHRQAEHLSREARLAANEEAAKLREQGEKALAGRRRGEALVGTVRREYAGKYRDGNKGTNQRHAAPGGVTAEESPLGAGPRSTSA